MCASRIARGTESAPADRAQASRGGPPHTPRASPERVACHVGVLVGALAALGALAPDDRPGGGRGARAPRAPRPRPRLRGEGAPRGEGAAEAAEPPSPLGAEPDRGRAEPVMGGPVRGRARAKSRMSRMSNGAAAAAAPSSAGAAQDERGRPPTRPSPTRGTGPTTRPNPQGSGGRSRTDLRHAVPPVEARRRAPTHVLEPASSRRTRSRAAAGRGRRRAGRALLQGRARAPRRARGLARVDVDRRRQATVGSSAAGPTTTATATRDRRRRGPFCGVDMGTSCWLPLPIVKRRRAWARTGGGRRRRGDVVVRRPAPRGGGRLRVTVSPGGTPARTPRGAPARTAPRGVTSPRASREVAGPPSRAPRLAPARRLAYPPPTDRLPHDACARAGVSGCQQARRARALGDRGPRVSAVSSERARPGARALGDRSAARPARPSRTAERARTARGAGHRFVCANAQGDSAHGARANI